MNQYSLIYTFTKKANLLEYFTNKISLQCDSQEQYTHMREYYAREREVQLVCMFRWEKDRCFCRIRCPINPLPVKGEFETPGSTAQVVDFLEKQGWNFQQKFHYSMLK